MKNRFREITPFIYYWRKRSLSSKRQASFSLLLLMQRLRGLSEVHEGIYWSATLCSTSCRGFVVESASLRRCDDEGSPCQRWGLGNLVESKKWLAFAELKVQHKQSRAPVQSKLFMSLFSNAMILVKLIKITICVHLCHLWLLITIESAVFIVVFVVALKVLAKNCVGFGKKAYLYIRFQ